MNWTAMKTIALFLSLPLFAADPRFVTVRLDQSLALNQSLTLKAGEAAELVSANGLVSLVAYAENGQIIGGVSVDLQHFHGKFLPFAIAGPAKLAVVSTPGWMGRVGPGYATLRVWPGATDPQAVALVPPGTNAVTIRLEASTNLVSWSAVHEVTLTNVPAATFYRAKASP
jgi:hypothetical protein